MAGNGMRYARAHKQAKTVHITSGGQLKVPRTGPEKLWTEVKRARLKREAELRREAA